MGVLPILLEKEMLQFRRSKFLPRLVLMFPIMVMLIIPLVATMDVRNVNVVVVDMDRSETTARIVSDMDASGSLELSGYAETFPEALSCLERGEADVIVEFPQDYEKGIVCGSPEPVSISANGVNATKGQLGAQYLSLSLVSSLRRMASERGNSLPPETIFVRNRYNPTLNYRFYMIPALMIILVIMICGFLPALNLVGEKESGTIEQINVSPVSRFTFTLSKLIPYWVIGLIVLTLAMAVGRLVYGLVPAGPVFVIYLATFLFSLVMSGLGMTIANFSSTMQQSMYVMFFFIIIFQLMSGLMTPIDSMPVWAQYLTYLIPPRYFIEIMRSVYLKGCGVADLLKEFIPLAISAVLLCLAAMLTYRKRS